MIWDANICSRMQTVQSDIRCMLDDVPASTDMCATANQACTTPGSGAHLGEGSITLLQMRAQLQAKVVAGVPVALLQRCHRPRRFLRDWQLPLAMLRAGSAGALSPQKTRGAHSEDPTCCN